MIDHQIPLRITLAHDWLIGMRGGEWVLDRLARRYGPTTLYTLVDEKRKLTEAIRGCRIVTSELQRWPGAAGALRRFYLPLMPWAVSRIRIEPCDLVISTSSAVIKSIRPPAGARHLCYCHSPARYLWEQSSDYAVGAGGKLRSLGLGMLRRRFQDWDRATADRVSRFLANSRHTAARIDRCYGRRATVVYPPVRTEFFTADPRVERRDWYLVVGALEPYKRTDLVVAAANRAGFPVKIAGGGSQEKALARQAGRTVQLLGRVTDDEMRNLYRAARALIFPQREDFGIIAVEAQAAGCPVVAFRGGGAEETVTAQTGVLFDRQEVDELISAVERFETVTIDSQACRRNAERFSETIFDDAIEREVKAVLAGDQR